MSILCISQQHTIQPIEDEIKLLFSFLQDHIPIYTKPWVLLHILHSLTPDILSRATFLTLPLVLSLEGDLGRPDTLHALEVLGTVDKSPLGVGSSVDEVRLSRC